MSAFVFASCRSSLLHSPSNRQIARTILAHGKATSSTLQQTSTDVSETLAEEGIFTSEHVELRRSLKKLIDTEINPFVDKWEAQKSFPAHQVFKALGSAGFLGINKPVEYGGLGLDYTFQLAFAEEIGSIKAAAVGMAIGVQTDMSTPALARYGSHELRNIFLSPSIAGDMVGCVGVSEVQAGSDVASIKTKAVKDGDDYVINGGKMWTTNGAQADWMCLLANTSESKNPYTNKSLIMLPMKSPGVTVSKNIEKLGMHSSDTVQSYFEDVRVPQSYRIGEEGMGFMYQMWQFQEERLYAGATALLMLENCITETAKYCSERKAFGKSILDNQAVHFRLAELQTEIELTRSLIYRAAGLYRNGVDVTKLASMAKLKCGRLSREVTDSCLQYWGGMGYTDIGISRSFRDARLLSIGGGADEVMLGIISKHMGMLSS